MSSLSYEESLIKEITDLHEEVRAARAAERAIAEERDQWIAGWKLMAKERVNHTEAALKLRNALSVQRMWNANLPFMDPTEAEYQKAYDAADKAIREFDERK